jgi:hypothetical protein
VVAKQPLKKTGWNRIKAAGLKYLGIVKDSTRTHQLRNKDPPKETGIFSLNLKIAVPTLRLLGLT